MKIQSPCVSVEQAIAYFGIRFGGEDPDPPVPIHPYRTFDIPTILSECVNDIANWGSVKDSFPLGWDDNEFRLAGEPYPWCDTLADGCNCHGSEDELSAAYCSDFGLAGDAEKRASKSPNVRYAENLKRWEERAAARENSSGEQPPYRDAVIRMAESILPAEPDPDRLIIVVVTDRKDPRGGGVVITLQRNPIDGLHEVPVTYYSAWENCLEVLEDRMNG
ncbi:MAG: hypothetical protein F4Y88_01795 [Chloroflexi bacterium]|nr:hypothetical protein [Chloroflexota bacterium]